MFHQLSRLVFIAGLAGLVAIAFWPYHDGALRYGLVISLAAIWTAGIKLLWHRKILRVVLAILPAVAAAPFLLPAKPLDPARLREGYLDALREMEGVPYLWGGESPRGIDCSGLPRRALRDALWADGWKRGNGLAFRKAASLWWYDSSAKAMGENYRSLTRSTGVRGKLRDLDFSMLAPGDLGVTANGRHVMVYLGNDEWIQADPGPLAVSIGKPATDPNPWFDALVSVQRWTELEARKTASIHGQ